MAEAVAGGAGVTREELRYVITGIVLLVIGAVTIMITSGIGKYIITTLNQSVSGLLTGIPDILTPILSIIGPVMTILGIAFLVWGLVLIIKKLRTVTETGF